MLEDREARRAEIRAILQEGPSELPGASLSANESPKEYRSKQDEERRAEIRAILQSPPMGAMPSPAPKKSEEFSWPAFIVQQVGKGALALPDLLQSIAYMQAKKDFQPGPWESRKAKKPLPEELAPEYYASNLIPETQVAETGLQRIAGKALQFAGAAALPIPGMGGLANLAKSTARSARIGAGMGAASGILEEGGVSELPANLIGMLAPSAISGAARGIGKLIPSMAKKEAKVGSFLQEKMGPSQTQKVIKNIEGVPTYKHIPYEPLSSEVSESPVIAQLTRARLGEPGAGYGERLHSGNEALGRALERQTLEALPSEEIKGRILEKLKHREMARRNATQEGYDSVEKLKTKMSPTGLVDYLHSKPTAGVIKKDLDAIERDLSISKFGKFDREYNKIYENASPHVQAQMQKRLQEVPVNKLAAIDKSLTTKIKDLKEARRKARAFHLKEAQEALRTDLDRISPTYAQARSTYADLSKPVNEILEHPVLRNVPRKKVDDMMSALFSNSKGTTSKENMETLKNILGENSAQWKEIQDSVIHHLEKNSTNFSATGRGSALSYPKLNKFLQRHENALEVSLGREQLDFLDDFKNILKGREHSIKLGEVPGSPTQARLRAELGIEKGLGLKGLSYGLGAFKPGLFKKATAALLGRWMESHDKETLRVLDEALKNPPFMKELLSRDFKGPSDFNKFLQTSIRVAPVMASPKSERKE